MDVTTGKLESYDVLSMGMKSKGSFTITESPEFYAVLSDTMYPHKTLAVGREIICNAWDAHLDAGITEPVKVTITSDPDNPSLSTLKVRDFGKGINHDIITDIYCTYGRSTKIKDKKATGGFGLGTKAPFSLVPHFTVTDYNDGLKVIYKAIREGLEDGKPEFTELFSEPTTETGLEVSIVLPTNEAKEVFEIIQCVSTLGGINVELNGKINYNHTSTKCELPFYVIAKNLYKTDTDHSETLDYYQDALGFSYYEDFLYVRLGTVLYPINKQSVDSTLYIKLTTLRDTYIKSPIILNAEPNSIRIVPSREALSYNQVTIKEINRLMDKSIRLINKIVFTDTDKRFCEFKRKINKDVNIKYYNFISELQVKSKFRQSIIDYNEIAKLVLTNRCTKFLFSVFDKHKNDKNYFKKFYKFIEELKSNNLIKVKKFIHNRNYGLSNDITISNSVDTLDKFRHQSTKLHEVNFDDFSFSVKLKPMSIQHRGKLDEDSVEKIKTIASNYGFNLNYEYKEPVRRPKLVKQQFKDTDVNKLQELGNDDFCINNVFKDVNLDQIYSLVYLEENIEVINCYTEYRDVVFIPTPYVQDYRGVHRWDVEITVSNIRALVKHYPNISFKLIQKTDASNLKKRKNKTKLVFLDDFINQEYIKMINNFYGYLAHTCIYTYPIGVNVAPLFTYINGHSGLSLNRPKFTKYITGVKLPELTKNDLEVINLVKTLKFFISTKKHVNKKFDKLIESINYEDFTKKSRIAKIVLNDSLITRESNELDLIKIVKLFEKQPKVKTNE